jgi:hypothetical protein
MLVVLFAWPISIVTLLIMDINESKLVELTIATVSGLNILITLRLSGSVSRWLRRVIGVGLLAVGIVLAVATALLVAVVLILGNSWSVDLLTISRRATR